MAATEAGSRAARALDDLYRRHGAEVYRFAYAMLGNRADAEDVTQTTFVNALRALEQGQSPRKASSWLLAISHNIVRQRFRQARARPSEVELHDELPGAAPADDDSPTLASVVDALGRIPPSQREAIVLREFEGRSYAEIADMLGISTSALETLLFRARRSLAEELENLVTCELAEQSISRALDGRLSRKERKRLAAHMRDCPACMRFELVQKRGRRALRGLALLPIPVSLTLLKGTNTAAAATLPTIGTAAAVSATAGGGGAAAAGGVAAGAFAVKAAAVVAAVGVAGGVGYTGAQEIRGKGEGSPRSSVVRPVTPPGQTKGQGGVHRGRLVRAVPAAKAVGQARGQRQVSPSTSAPGQAKRPGTKAAVPKVKPKPPVQATSKKPKHVQHAATAKPPSGKAQASSRPESPPGQARTQPGQAQNVKSPSADKAARGNPANDG